jgi:CMP-N,N'-diacetyllegionaminic acid synthase
VVTSLLALVPARGGSKGIPRKNLKIFAGKPLIAWTIESAKRASCVDRVVVTTEDAEIAQLALSLGADVPFMRPAELATDHTPGIAPVLHALEQLPDFEWVLLLQPTSPLRTTQDIEDIWSFCQQRQVASVVAVSKVGTSPSLMYYRGSNDVIEPVLQTEVRGGRRQDFPDTYQINGALYLAQAEWLKAHGSFVKEGTLGFEMPPERSVDVDTLRDWQWAEFLMARGCS